MFKEFVTEKIFGHKTLKEFITKTFGHKNSVTNPSGICDRKKFGHKTLKDFVTKKIRSKKFGH